jgi:hypothetical protein
VRHNQFNTFFGERDLWSLGLSLLFSDGIVWRCLSVREHWLGLSIALWEPKLTITVIYDVNLVIFWVFRLTFVVLCSYNEAGRILFHTTTTCFVRQLHNSPSLPLDRVMVWNVKTLVLNVFDVIFSFIRTKFGFNRFNLKINGIHVCKICLIHVWSVVKITPVLWIALLEFSTGVYLEDLFYLFSKICISNLVSKSCSAYLRSILLGWTIINLIIFRHLV